MLPSPVEEQSTNCITFREIAVLTDALKELAADGKPESEVVFYPRLESFVEFNLQRDDQTR